jgi:hypothetical protein
MKSLSGVLRFSVLLWAWSGLACTSQDTPRIDVEQRDLSDGDGEASVIDAIDLDGGELPDASPMPAPRHFTRFESTLDIGPERYAGLNPFDPREFRVDVDFEAPDGQRFRVPAFLYQDYTRALESDGRERLTPVGEPEWRVRFRPPMGSPEGEWQYSHVIEGPDGTQSSIVRTFVPEVTQGHGVLRRSAHDSRYLAFEDGAPYVAIGENLAWYNKGGTFDYDRWMGEIAENGGNYLRVWMPSWAFGLEWTRREDGEVTSRLGDYGDRLDRAWKLDHVFDKADELDLQVMLTLQNHGPFSTLHASEWENNPYNIENGGPLAMPVEFFTNEEARRLFRQRLRYIVARWGYSEHLLAWELWNEVDLVTDPNTPEVLDWTIEMAQELRRLDMHEHLVTTSIGGLDLFAAFFSGDIPDLVSRHAFWGLPEIEFTQIHFYGLGPTPIDFGEALPLLIDYLHAFDKPALVAEAGVTAVGMAETRDYDPVGDGFHDILWAGLFAQGFGTGMSWWWDGINHPDGLVRKMAPVSRLVRGIAFDRVGFVRETLPTSDDDVRALALRGDGVVIAWLKFVPHQWSSSDMTEIQGLTLTLPGLERGAYRVTWLDPHLGEEDHTATVELELGEVLEVPAFEKDIALRVERLP